MTEFNWRCPHCEHAVTISSNRYSSSQHTVRIKNADGRHTLLSQFIVCPNRDCQKYTLTAQLHESFERQNVYDDRLGTIISTWPLVPPSSAKSFPSYVPSQILEDYKEACLIRDLSPKASATLSRRCLQGILRDYWGVKPGRLIQEIAAIQDRVDPITWNAIDAVRKIGNIGAHMEKDIDVIIEVDPGEAGLLTELVETLLVEWYVARAQRQARMEAVISAAESKGNQ